MASPPNRLVLPIIPLPRDSVLLPGITHRIPISSRPDIPALLTSAYSRVASTSSIIIGCVPLCSPLLSPEGQFLVEGSEDRVRNTARRLLSTDSHKVGSGRLNERDLFVYGVTAKITGVQGRKQSELRLVVDGLRRFRVERLTQFRPFTECEVTVLGEEGRPYISFTTVTITLTITVIEAGDSEAQALFQQLKQLSGELISLVRLSSLFGRSSSTLSPIVAQKIQSFIARKEFEEAGMLADFMTNVVETTYEEKLRILAALDPKERVRIAIALLERQTEGMKGKVQITTFSSSSRPSSLGLDITNLPQQQREALMRRGLGSQFPSGLMPPGGGNPAEGNADSDMDEIQELKVKLDEAKLSAEAQKVADKELKRLRKINPMQAEYGVCRTYLENLAEIPWTKATEDQLGTDTLSRARKQLDDDHYGLDKIKKRLLEYLAVLKLKQTITTDREGQIKEAEEEASHSREKSSRNDGTPTDEDVDAQIAKIQVLKSKRTIDKSPILLLVGPPGTGKTSLAKSVATALGRKFHRISLGGVRDEAEIRGHRRTYVAAMPGLIVNGLKKAGVANPVFLLDEIDKVGGQNFHGDPSAAMLEVLDPEQNHTFTDHYLNIPLDLSKVLFIATANTLDTIPPPLLDRMETIFLSGYTTLEKRHIASRHLIPKQILSNGLSAGDVRIGSDIIDELSTSYTRESGVRSLEREIGSLCRAKAVAYSDARDAGTLESSYNPQLTLQDLHSILGSPRFDPELALSSTPVPGIVTGLVAFSSGTQGSILFIEVADLPGGSGRVQLTGQLGDVLKESVEVALSWVKGHACDLGLTSEPGADIMKDRSVHVHCPAGAVPKDGPSAGLAHVVALVSLFSGKPVPAHIAMTGEVSLRGRVMPVGGIREKLVGALRAGVGMVLLPKRNERDLEEVPAEVREGLETVLVEGIWEALGK
ncbi:MAG: hypothetical protein LQ340_007077, partial [Diploschistes diacapsis]